MNQLSADKVTKRFGSVVAVDSVSLTLAEGEIHGLIGPNGSGKTTLLNLLSGYYPADAGALSLDGAPITQASVQRRALSGIARTFQKPRLLGSLSAWQNVMLGNWKHSNAGFLQTALALPGMRRRERQARELAYEMLCGVGLERVAERPANMLDHAEQRFLEIARGLAMKPRFILLDEPAGGLTEHEIEQLSRIVATLREAGIGVLIVEHHTDFVFRLCDRVTTLNLGRMIAHGAPADVRGNAEVIRVYLGA
ncbi:ABC transporter ATP-binding protein [Bordetella petrii]|uniref:ABC transporter ATP-binding protein n=1 Tax=Bordetella petrii TaxID=94624 RepID=UPI001E43A864|nr:ABC transporter ATP-binding protein [Bordetella petrii]MCD0501824.1 ABC transporter ATP-binding protein [Bordetella petrii]